MIAYQLHPVWEARCEYRSEAQSGLFQVAKTACWAFYHCLLRGGLAAEWWVSRGATHSTVLCTALVEIRLPWEANGSPCRCKQLLLLRAGLNPMGPMSAQWAPHFGGPCTSAVSISPDAAAGIAVDCHSGG